ncbi:MAG: trypsin-like peptidase domain-containing protein [Gemmatimonadota bacterium]
MTRIEIEIVSGARAGTRAAFEKSYIALGRDPLADVRFDAEADLDASTKHAAIVATEDGYLVRDLGSRNGTYLNRHLISEDAPLADGDVVRCGARGPEVRVRIVKEQAEQIIPKVAAPAPAAKPAAAPIAPRATDAPPKPAGPSATSVLRAEVKASAARYRAVMVTLGIVVVGAAAVLIWQGTTARRQQQQLASVVDTLRTQIVSLQIAKAAADSEAARLQRDIRAAAGNPARLATLQREYSDVQRRQRDIQTAQGVDYDAIQRANTAAIAVIAVRFLDTTEMEEGTAFSVNARGLMLTNRHVVVNSAGEQARDVAVRFSNSAEVLPARIVRVSPDADLAVLQVETPGPFPAVSGFAPGSTTAGSPIALIGFPGGCGGCVRPRAKLVTGSVTSASDSLLEMDAFSGTGASGSPIFDRNGLVVGVLFGGRGGASSTEIVGLPIQRAMALIR